MLVPKEEIQNILGVGKNALKAIEHRNTLQDRLMDKGYKLTDKIKQGRKVFYDIEKISEYREILHNIIEHHYNTTKYEEFSKYVMTRKTNIEEPISKAKISQITNVNPKTINKWDQKMIENNILGKDGCFYIALEYIDGKPTYRYSCKEEYYNYRRESRIAKMKSRVLDKFKNDEIDEDEFKLMYDGILRTEEYLEPLYIYRIKKFFIKENQELLKDLCKLINTVYNISENECKFKLVK